MTPVLRRPTRPLPRKFSRPLTKQTRTFVERRHKRAKEHSRERWRRWLRRAKTVFFDRLSVGRRWLRFILPGIGTLVICLLLFSPLLHIRQIRVVRAEGRVDLPVVLEALSPLYDRHLLFLSARDVAARVREVVPDASDVIVSKRYPSELHVRIALLPLIARVRIESPGETPQPVSSSSSSVAPVRTGSGSAGVLSGSGSAPGGEFLTQNGLLVSVPNPGALPPLPTIRIVDWSVRPVPMMPLLSPEFIERMRRAEEALALEFGQQIRLRTAYVRAREFHLDTPVVSYWFDTRSTLEEQLARLRIFLKSVKLADVKSYIDLRLTGRVVYK